MSKKTDQLNVRVESEMLRDLETIARVEKAGIPELVRSWIREKIREYQKDPRYRKMEAEKVEDEN